MQTLKAGAIFDERFEVVEVLGTGAFGTVYKAKQPQFDRFVAIKVLHKTAIDSDEMARFEREAQATNALKHKNIIGLYGFGVWQGAPYMVTEFAEGKSLFSILERAGQLDRRRAIEIMQQVLAALSCAHQQGVIHRDLKPSNIMLARESDGNESIKIIDFGLAKLLPGYGIPSQKLTETGFALGTCQYMSPEQCTGRPVDQRSDLYSAGCIMYQCLSGRLPFDADEAVMIMYQHLNEFPDALTRFLPDDSTTSALQNFCNNCLAKDSDDRYATAQEALRDLDAIALGQSAKVKAFAPVSSGKGRRTITERKKTSLLPYAAVAVVLVAGTSYLYRSPQAVAPEKSPQVEAGVSAVPHELGDLSEEQLADRMWKGLVRDLELDSKSHTLSPFERARMGFLVATHFRHLEEWPLCEFYARLGWDQRRLCTRYPERARKLLIIALARQGKFNEAEDLLRRAAGEQGYELIYELGVTLREFALVNRPDRGRRVLESILKEDTLTARVRMYCYSILGDLSLQMGKVADARSYYQRGTQRGDKDDSTDVNPCWVGVMRMALFDKDLPLAHKYAKRLADAGLPDLTLTHFPLERCAVLMMTDAASTGDVAKTKLYADKLEKVFNERGYGDFERAFDERLATAFMGENPQMKPLLERFSARFNQDQAEQAAVAARPKQPEVD